jgi:hypothetical protein
VDDFVLGFQHKEDALRFERVLKKRLEKFSLTLEPTKTQLVEFGRFADRNMKQKGERPKTLYFLGFTFYCSKNRNGRFKVGMITEKTRLRRGFQNLKLLLRKNRHLALRLQIRKINAFLAGHYNYYGLSGNSRAIRNIYYFAVKYWRKMLNSRSQRGYMDWEKYGKILKFYAIRKPKIRYTYYNLSEMALL